MKKDSTIRTIWRLLYPYIVYLAITVLVQMIMIIPEFIKLAKESTTTDYNELYDALMQLVYDKAMLYTFVSGIVAIPFLYLFFYLDKKRCNNNNMLVSYEPLLLRTYLYTALLGIGACLALNNLIDLSGLVNFSPVYQELADKVFGGGFWITFLASAIMAPILEELLFRGLIYKRLRFVCKPVTAGIISSVAFGITHGNLVQFVYAFFAGMLLAYVYEQYKNLWAPILFHFCANALSLAGSEVIVGNYDVKLKIALLIAETFAVISIYKMIGKKVNRQIKPVDAEGQGAITCTIA